MQRLGVWLEEVRSLAANEAALHTLQQPGRLQLQLDIWIFSHVEGHLFRFVFLSPQSGALGRGFHTLIAFEHLGLYVQKHLGVVTTNSKLEN